MDILILCILGLLIVVMRYFKIGDYFSPWMITLVIWFAMFFMFQFQNDVLYPMAPQFYESFAIWMPIFLVSSLLTFYLLPGVPDEESACISDMHLNHGVFNVLFAISVIITPLYAWQILKIVTMFDTTDLLYNIRIFAIYGEDDFGFLNYAFVINQALLIVAIWKYPAIPLWQLIVVYLTNTISCLAIMEKGGMFIMVTTTLFMLFERKIIKTRSIVITILAVIAIFFFMNMAREEQSSDADSMTFVDFFAIYVLSPPVAYGRVAVDLATQFGSHTFQTIYLFLNRFGGDYEVNVKLQEFVMVPLPTNVYTIFQPFFQDFGQRGIAIFALAYGFLSGVSYRYFRNGSAMGRCFYSFMVYVLILQFYQENIMMSMVFTVQLVFFMWIMVEKRYKIRL